MSGPIQRVRGRCERILVDADGRPGAAFLKASRERRVSPIQLLSARKGIQVVPRKFFALSHCDSGRILLEVITVRCPFCNAEMEKGLLQGGSIMVWVKKKHIVSLLPKKGEVILDRNYLTSSAVPAWICKSCKKVIAEYAQKNEIEF